MNDTDTLAGHGRWSNRRSGRKVLSGFETTPAWLFYLPVAAWWMMLALRYRSLTLPALANTAIRAGGLCGESKAEALDLLGPEGQARCARYIVLERWPGDGAEAAADRAMMAMGRAGLSFPLVAKPEIGRNGRGVRRIDDRRALIAYFAGFRAPVGVVLQEFVPWEGEAGIFYVRRPGAARGHITSVTLKYFPVLVGDGRRNLHRLLMDDPRAGQVPQFYLGRLAHRLTEVPARGEVVPLVFTGNHCQGAVFRDGTAIVTPAMEACFDRIAREAPGFHFGRFDLRYRDLAALRRGEGFRIIEVNGAGAEATHIWDARTRLLDAYRTLFTQIATAFRIGDAVRRREGRRPIGPIALLRLYFGEIRAMKGYPPA